MIEEEIEVPIYNARIILIITNNLPHAMSGYSDENCDNDIAITIHFDTPLKYVMGFDAGKICHMVVAHEVCHVTHRLMNDVGIPPSLLNDEAEAYLQGYITNEVYKVIKTNKLMCYGKKN